MSSVLLEEAKFLLHLSKVPLFDLFFLLLPLLEQLVWSIVVYPRTTTIANFAKGGELLVHVRNLPLCSIFLLQTLVALYGNVYRLASMRGTA
jgi:hypothetical protein